MRRKYYYKVMAVLTVVGLTVMRLWGCKREGRGSGSGWHRDRSDSGK